MKKYFIGGLVLGLLIMLVLVGGGIFTVEHTSSVKFCASCHEMKVFHETWLAGPHGPKKDTLGVIRAQCVDCHLPHDNPYHYLFKKGISGTRDLFAHYFKKKIDWVAKLEDAKNYVYDSGCLKCHVELPPVPSHEQYLRGELEDMSCIECHSEVGHGFDLEEKLRGLSQSED